MKTEKQTKTKRTSAEKLAVLIEQRKKLIIAKDENSKKSKEIDNRLSAANEKK